MVRFFIFFSLSVLAAVSLAQSPDRPNILWISCEDLSPHFSFYGDSTISTPNLDRLAREGVVYENVFATAGVCAPSRCAIITGVNQVTAGGHNMRTLNNTYPEKTGLPGSYSIVPSPEIKAFPEFLRARGYYCTNNSKTDYQFEAPPTVWDESSTKASWRNRNRGQPFFSVVNYTITHESQVWERKHLPLKADPSKIKVPPYYPDTKTVRRDMARFYSNVADMDSLVGTLLTQLQDDGLMENTIIFFWSDHGDGLPFAKRELYDRGLKIPLVIRFPNKINAATKNHELISTIDFAPTVLSLAGINSPAYIQGRAFLGAYKKPQSQYVFAARDRMDSEYDRVRALRDKRYKYIRNFYPDRPRYQDIEYRLQQDMMKEILTLKEQGKLNSIQLLWFEPVKPVEELYDLLSDPYELRNLASDPARQSTLISLREAMNKWIKASNDLGAIPEKDLVKKMWRGGAKPPITDSVNINVAGTVVTLSCKTPGASIGYKIVESGKEEPVGWQPYTSSFNVERPHQVKAVAQRIGFEKSVETTRELKAISE